MTDRPRVAALEAAALTGVKALQGGQQRALLCRGRLGGEADRTLPAAVAGAVGTREDELPKAMGFASAGAQVDVETLDRVERVDPDTMNVSSHEFTS